MSAVPGGSGRGAAEAGVPTGGGWPPRRGRGPAGLARGPGREPGAAQPSRVPRQPERDRRAPMAVVSGPPTKACAARTVAAAIGRRRVGEQGVDQPDAGLAMVHGAALEELGRDLRARRSRTASSWPIAAAARVAHTSARARGRWSARAWATRSAAYAIPAAPFCTDAVGACSPSASSGRESRPMRPMTSSSRRSAGPGRGPVRARGGADRTAASAVRSASTDAKRACGGLDNARASQEQLHLLEVSRARAARTPRADPRQPDAASRLLQRMVVCAPASAA